MTIVRVINIADNASPLSSSGISFDVPALLLCVNGRQEVKSAVGVDEM